MTTKSASTPGTRSTSISSKTVADVALGVAGLGTLFVAWSYLGETTRFIVPITDVVASLPEFLSKAATWQAAGETWTRILVSLLVGVLLGCAVGVLMWKTDLPGKVASYWVTVFLAVPSTISAMIGVFLFRDRNLGAVFVIALTLFPFVAVMLCNALGRLDPGLSEMANSYRLGWFDRVRYVIFPQVFPAFMSALRNEHAHAWKIVVVVEMFLVSSGMGFEFDKAFDRFNLLEVMQWLVVFAAILLATEYLILRPLENRSRRWKGQQ